MKARPSERGMALIIVIWLFLVLTVLVSEFGRRMRDDAVATFNMARTPRLGA